MKSYHTCCDDGQLETLNWRATSRHENIGTTKNRRTLFEGDPRKRSDATRCLKDIIMNYFTSSIANGTWSIIKLEDAIAKLADNQNTVIATQQAMQEDIRSLTCNSQLWRKIRSIAEAYQFRSLTTLHFLQTFYIDNLIKILEKFIRHIL